MFTLLTKLKQANSEGVDRFKLTWNNAVIGIAVYLDKNFVQPSELAWIEYRVILGELVLIIIVIIQLVRRIAMRHDICRPAYYNKNVKCVSWWLVIGFSNYIIKNNHGRVLTQSFCVVFTEYFVWLFIIIDLVGYIS